MTKPPELSPGPLAIAPATSHTPAVQNTKAIPTFLSNDQGEFMDDRRFDSLVRTMASGASRRQVLKGLLGLGAGSVGAAVVAGGADAARRGYSGPNVQPPPSCYNTCRPDQCGGSDGCGGTCGCAEGRTCTSYGTCAIPCTTSADCRGCACRPVGDEGSFCIGATLGACTENCIQGVLCSGERCFFPC